MSQGSTREDFHSAANMQMKYSVIRWVLCSVGLLSLLQQPAAEEERSVCLTLSNNTYLYFQLIHIFSLLRLCEGAKLNLPNTSETKQQYSISQK